MSSPLARRSDTLRHSLPGAVAPGSRGPQLLDGAVMPQVRPWPTESSPSLMPSAVAPLLTAGMPAAVPATVPAAVPVTVPATMPAAAATAPAALAAMPQVTPPAMPAPAPPQQQLGVARRAGSMDRQDWFASASGSSMDETIPNLRLALQEPPADSARAGPTTLPQAVSTMATLQLPPARSQQLTTTRDDLMATRPLLTQTDLPGWDSGGTSVSTAGTAPQGSWRYPSTTGGSMTAGVPEVLRASPYSSYTPPIGQLPSAPGATAPPGPAESRWPHEVTKYLDMAPQGVGTRPKRPPGDPRRNQLVTGLRLVSGACQIPHPQKADRDGEDSYFIGADGFGFGVADGVGEWEKMKVNPRVIADEIMANSKISLESMGRQPMNGVQAPQRALLALKDGFDAANSFGACTVTVVVLDPKGSSLGVANVGDSGLRQLRKGGRMVANSSAMDSGPSWVVARTREQQHFFNCPYQLSKLPTPADHPALLAQGKQALVEAMKRGNALQQDRPEDADLYNYAVAEGDLLVLGTDGVFDNLHDEEICDLVELTISPLEARQVFVESSGTLRGPGSSTDPGALATTIAHAAFHRSLDLMASTPFAENARNHGFKHSGGKTDDITVVCAWIVRSVSSAS